LVEVFLGAIDLGTVSKLRYFSDKKSLDILHNNPIGAFRFNLLHRISIGYPLDIQSIKMYRSCLNGKITIGVEMILFHF